MYLPDKQPNVWRPKPQKTGSPPIKARNTLLLYQRTIFNNAKLTHSIKWLNVLHKQSHFQRSKKITRSIFLPISFVDEQCSSFTTLPPKDSIFEATNKVTSLQTSELWTMILSTNFHMHYSSKKQTHEKTRNGPPPNTRRNCIQDKGPRNFLPIKTSSNSRKP